MTFTEYQEAAQETAQYPELVHPIIYPILGLGGEAGEVQEKIKKVFRDKHGIFSEDDTQEIAHELGDVLWYLATIATVLDISMEDVARGNILKLRSRKKRGVISGNGDSR